jgi:ribosome biogenesis GTPase A
MIEILKVNIQKWFNNQHLGVDPNNLSEDYTIIVVRDKNSGKSTFINRIQEKGKLYTKRKAIFTHLADAVVPSTAMEHSYARRVKKYSNGGDKDIIHTWEIGN